LGESAMALSESVLVLSESAMVLSWLSEVMSGGLSVAMSSRKNGRWEARQESQSLQRR
jgi:hypothetical protein